MALSISTESPFTLLTDMKFDIGKFLVVLPHTEYRDFGGRVGECGFLLLDTH